MIRSCRDRLWIHGGREPIDRDGGDSRTRGHEERQRGDAGNREALQSAATTFFASVFAFESGDGV